jgi:hypothetical protein
MGNRRTRRKNLSQCHFVHQKPQMNPGVNLGLRGAISGSNRLSHGTDLNIIGSSCSLGSFFNSRHIMWFWLGVLPGRLGNQPYQTSFSVEMSFTQGLVSTWREGLLFPLLTFNKYFGNDLLSPLSEMFNNISSLLVNSHLRLTTDTATGTDCGEFMYQSQEAYRK